MAAVSTRPRREHMEPLWDRVDRNRLKLAVLVFAFIVGSALGLVSLLAIPWFVLLLQSAPTLSQLWPVFWTGIAYAGLAVALVAGAWAGYTLLRSEKWLLARFNATLVPRGELLETKFALKDMALAAGLSVAPALYIMPETSTNAFVFAARRRRAVVGVTGGFTRKLTVDQQRAVFANLVARLASGDTIVSTGVTALMWPVHAWRESRLTVDETIDPDDTFDSAQPSGEGQGDRRRGGSGLVLYFAFGMGFALLAELIAAGHRQALRSTAEKADAEGMLLLKDPVTMVSALKRCIELNNVVPIAGEAFAELFYCWTGISSDDEDDPEWTRVARLREVLGVMGYEPDANDDLGHEANGPPAAPRLDTPESDLRLKG